jgi:hypothetical protein
MSRTDDLLRRASDLAEQVRRRRADHAGRAGRGADDLAALEARLARLWEDIRAARAGGPRAEADPVRDRPSRPKWG